VTRLSLSVDAGGTRLADGEWLRSEGRRVAPGSSRAAGGERAHARRREHVVRGPQLLAR
jgi:hypothetical protein